MSVIDNILSFQDESINEDLISVFNLVKCDTVIDDFNDFNNGLLFFDKIHINIYIYIYIYIYISSIQT